MTMNSKNIETILINVGKESLFTQGAINPIIQKASSLVFSSIAHKNKATAGRFNGELFYGRHGTLTHFSLQKMMVELEGGAGCALYPCGTAAIVSTILSFISAGNHILVVNSVYEPIQKFCQLILSKMNISITWFDPLIGSNIIHLIQNNTQLIVLESPGSITMEVQDIPAIIKSVRMKNPKIVIILDNTWSAGILFKAINFGVDISLQSGTKYLTGHSDAMIGIAVSNQRCWEQLRDNSYLMGQTIDADTAYIAGRGLRTLSVRLKQHEKNGLCIAHWLTKRHEVAIVNHPALPECKGHKFFVRDFSGASGLFSFILKWRLSDVQIANYLDHFIYFRIAYSWGGYESLIMINQPEEIAAIRPGSQIDFKGTLIRLHIGLENTDDLIYDLTAGFHRITNIN